MRVTPCVRPVAFLIALLFASHVAGQTKQEAKRVDLVGKVTVEGGEPVAAANVVLIYKSWPGGRYRQQSLNSKTNKKGEFTFKQLYKAGEQTGFLVSIVKNGFTMNSEYVFNRRGENVKPFEFKMAAAQPLTIQLVDKKGKPLAETPVAPKQRTTPDNDKLFLYDQSLTSAQVLTDVEGKVEMSYFGVGDQADVAVLLDGRPTTVSFRVDGKNERRVTVDVKQKVDLTGVAVDEDSKELPDAKVLMIFKSWPGGRYRQAVHQTKTDKHGKFRFPQLYDSGDRTAFLVTIVQDGYAMQSQYVINQKGVKQDFKFALPTAKKLNVQLVDEGGEPLASASVVPSQRTTAGGDEHFVYPQSGPSIAKKTDANGKIDFHLFETGDSVDIYVTSEGKSTKVSFKVGSASKQVVRVGAANPDQGSSRRWTPKARAATPEQIAWIRKSAIPLKSIDPADEDFSDLQPLKKLIGDARFVQLGEQSHGDGTCFETKTRLIKFLHQEMGFDVLAFESGLFDCRKAWRAFRQGQPATQAASQGIFGIWTGSRQVQPLLEYLAAQANSDQPLELCGFDCQFTAAGSREHLVSDLRQLVDQLGITDPTEGNFKVVYAGLEQLLKRGQVPPTGQQEFLATLDGIIAALPEKNDLSEQQTRELLFWKQNLKSIKAHATARWASPAAPGVTTRDAQMAKNLIWLADDYYPDRKIIVWAASFHIMRHAAEIDVPDGSVNYERTEPMGHHVARQLRDDVFTMGFTAYEGTAGAYFRPKFAIGKAPDGTLEGLCNSAELTNAIIPLRGLEGGGEWLNEKQHSRPLGYTWMRARWPRHFDAICFNRTMEPSMR